MTRPNPTWCPGCGTYMVNHALALALKHLKVKPKDAVVCFDIGCSGNMSNVLDVCAAETLHGRSIPVACGIKAVREDLTVIAQAGDGGLLSEGLNHFIHAVQRNDPITLIVNNNHVFGLTAGQQSSATPRGVKARAAQKENPHLPLNAVDLAAAVGAPFIARVPEGDPKLMQAVFEKALSFRGFAIVEVIQPCKIWAKHFPKVAFRTLAKPATDPKDLIGKHNLTGLLYKARRADV